LWNQQSIAICKKNPTEGHSFKNSQYKLEMTTAEDVEELIAFGRITRVA
jgi:hypothetical protein